MEQLEHNQNCDYWLRFYSEQIPSEDAVLDFLCNKQSVQYLVNSSLPVTQQLAIAQKLLDELLLIPLDKLPELLSRVKELENVTTANIPQFSNFSSALVYLPKLLNDGKDSMTNKEVGYALHQACTSDVAATKYGENHAKLAIACGLAVATRKDGFAGVKISLLGRAYCLNDSETKLRILTRLCYRIPIIQRAVVSENKKVSLEENLLVLSASTRNRRRHNVYELLAYALDE